MTIVEQPFHFKQIKESIKALFAQEPQAKGRRLTVVYDDISATLLGDETRLRQILFNLIDSAVGEGTTVSLSLPFRLPVAQTRAPEGRRQGEVPGRRHGRLRVQTSGDEGSDGSDQAGDGQTDSAQGRRSTGGATVIPDKRLHPACTVEKT